jgi:hypothetical protein
VGVRSDRRVRPTSLPPPVSWLSRQCGILNISQPYRPPQPVTAIALLFFNFSFCKKLHHRHHTAQIQSLHFHTSLNIHHAEKCCEKFPTWICSKFHSILKFLHDVISWENQVIFEFCDKYIWLTEGKVLFMHTWKWKLTETQQKQTQIRNCII